MHRIDADAHVGNQFSDGNPTTGAPGTKVDANWLNAVQEEICTLLEACGITLVKGANQLVAAAVAAATPNRIVRRDSAGRAQFGTPAAAADAATKGYVDQRGAKAYALVNVAGGSATVVAGTGLNVASAGVTTLGDYVYVTFATEMASHTYCTVVTPSGGPYMWFVEPAATSKAGVGIKFAAPGGALIDMRTAGLLFSVAVF